MTQVIFYKSDSSSWTTEAHLHQNGDIIVTTGDYNNEWHCTILSQHKHQLAEALRREIDLCSVPDDAMMLNGLFHLFAGNIDPYTDIISFLERYSIPMTTFAWIGTIWDDT